MGRKLIERPLYSLIFLSFVFFVVVPVIYTLGTTFFVDGSIVSSFKLLDKKTFLLLAKSGVIAFIIALCSTFFGTILGFLLYKTNVVFRGFFKLSLLIPLFISPYIRQLPGMTSFPTIQ